MIRCIPFFYFPVSTYVPNYQKFVVAELLLDNIINNISFIENRRTIVI